MIAAGRAGHTEEQAGMDYNAACLQRVPARPGPFQAPLSACDARVCSFVRSFVPASQRAAQVCAAGLAEGQLFDKAHVKTTLWI